MFILCDKLLEPRKIILKNLIYIYFIYIYLYVYMA